MAETIGQLIKRIRQAKNLTQRDLVDAQVITNSCISLIERGTRKGMNARTLAKVCRYLDIPAETAFDALLGAKKKGTK